MKEHRIARQIVLEFIKTKKVFYLSEIKESILKNKGIMRVSTGVTVKEYLEDFDTNGIIKWSVIENNIKYVIL